MGLLRKIIKYLFFNFEGRREKNYFFVHIFDISPCVFTQILIGRDLWMQNLPTQHTFDGPLYPKNKKYLKKCDVDISVMFFHIFIVFGVAGSVKSMQCHLHGFSGIYWFSSSRVYQKYAVWVLVGCGIKFCIQ